MKENFSKENFPAHFILSNFEGPLELLLYLVQKEEIDICDIMLREITSQSETPLESVDTGAEFLALSSCLLLLKSRKLIPQEHVAEEVEEPRWEMLSKLVEYCHFKEVAKELSELESRQSHFFSRETSLPVKKRCDGLEEVNLQELTAVLQQVLEKAAIRPQEIIREEEWQIEPKISWLKEIVSKDQKIAFTTLFPREKCNEELIVTFLALLELMKLEHLKVIKEENTQTIFVIKNDESRT